MSARAALNVALAAAVAVLAWLAFGDAPGERSSERAPLSDLEPASVARIELERPGQTVVTIEKRAGRWRMSAPIAFPADPWRVRALLGMLEAPARTLAAGTQDFARFGLSPPRAAIRFDATELLIGDTEPVSGRRYVASGGRVRLVEDAWHSHLFSVPERLLDAQLVPAGSTLAAIDLGHGRWRLDAGSWGRTPADPTLAADAGPMLAERWISARGLSVSALDPSLPWRDGPRLELADGAGTLRFKIAREGRMVVLGRHEPPLQYRLSERQAALLLSDAVPARDAR